MLPIKSKTVRWWVPYTIAYVGVFVGMRLFT